MGELGDAARNQVLALVKGEILLGELMLQGGNDFLEVEVFDFETFGFLTLAFTRVVGGGAVALDSLNAALLLLVGSLGPLTGRQVGLGFR